MRAFATKTGTKTGTTLNKLQFSMRRLSAHEASFTSSMRSSASCFCKSCRFTTCFATSFPMLLLAVQIRCEETLVMGMNAWKTKSIRLDLAGSGSGWIQRDPTGPGHSNKEKHNRTEPVARVLSLDQIYSAAAPKANSIHFLHCNS